MATEDVNSENLADTAALMVGGRIGLDIISCSVPECVTFSLRGPSERPVL